MTHPCPDAILLAMPRSSWDALAGSREADVRRALGSLVQVDSCVHAAIRAVGGVVDEVVVSVHLDAVEAVADRWAGEGRMAGGAEVVVRSVPVGLTRPGEVH